jgi:nicotinate-nucleotide adenylyltransferase
MKLGVLGGTFDPIHLGHVDLALTARRILGLDEVHLVPCRQAPHKNLAPLAPGSDRLAMIALAAMEHEGLVPDSCELGRPAPSFTIDTLRRLAAGPSKPHLYFIMGMDSFRDIRQWKEHEALITEFNLVVFNRPGSPLPAEEDVPATARGRMLTGGATADPDRPFIHVLEMPPRDISSSTIRGLARSDKALTGLVPTTVESYIHRCRLYR